MEKLMGQIRKIAESKDMSMEELNNYFTGRKFEDIEGEYASLGHAPSPKEKAQDMLYDAMDLPSGDERKRMAEKALSIYPNLPDAWTILAEETATSAEDSLSFYERAVKCGEEDLGKKYFTENEGHFWGLIETRPYMRAKCGLAQVLWNLGREDEAIAHYQDCIRLNSSDNQGVRFLLLPCLLKRGDLEEADKLLKKYKTDGGAQHAYNKALFLFKKHGPESKMTEKQIDCAIRENPVIPKYLLGKLKMPKEMPGSYSLGSREEAIIYANEALCAWKETPGALVWLAGL